MGDAWSELLQSAQASAAHNERRRSRREPLITTGTVFPDGAGQDKPANHRQVLIVNVSMHGVGFRYNAPFEDQDVYHIRIGAGPLQLAARMRIVACRPRKDGMYDIGGEFF